MHIPSYNQIEGFVLTFTLVTVFIGVVLIFVVKLITLLSLYVTSGKLVTDFGTYIWKAFKSSMLGG